jgi:hypothetical protein
LAAAAAQLVLRIAPPDLHVLLNLIATNVLRAITTLLLKHFALMLRLSSPPSTWAR